MTLKTYTITLVDAVHYVTQIEARSADDARKEARQLWDDNFLRFSPVDDGSIEIISVEQTSAPLSSAGGVQ